MFYARFQGGTLDNLFTTGNGIYQHDHDPDRIASPGNQLAPAAQSPRAPPVRSSPTRWRRCPPTPRFRPPALQFLAPNLKTPYSEQGNIGIQRQLARDVAVSVSYLWSRGVQLYGVRDINLPTGTTNYTYTIDDVNGNAVGSYTTPV